MSAPKAAKATTPTPAASGGGHEEESESVITGLLAGLQGEILKDAGRSAIQPTVRRRAKVAAKWAQKFFPVNHPFRNDLSEVFLDFVGSRIRRMGKDGKTWAGIAIEEVGEFVKMFGEEFCNEENGAEKGSKPPISPEQAKMADELDKEFLKLVAYLNHHTSADDYAELEKIIRSKGELNHLAKELAFNGPKETPEPKQPSVPLKQQIRNLGKGMDELLGESLAPINKELGPAVARLNAHNAKLKLEAASREPEPSSPLTKLFRWLAK